MKKLLKTILQIVPRPNATFLIDVDEDIAFSRKDDVASRQYLVDRRKNYLKVAKWCKMDIIDGNNSIENIHTYLLKMSLSIFDKGN